MEQYYHLDYAQQKAVCHTHGPALVVAGPGSGKTSTLLKHISFLLENHFANPPDILVITYTREAAMSMKKRYEKEHGRNFDSFTFCTFHSLSYQILQKETHFKNNGLISEKEKEKLLFLLLQKFGENTELVPDYLRLFSLRKNGCHIEEELRKSGLEKERFESIFGEYGKEVKRKGKLDFDDMLYDCKCLLEDNEGVRKRWQNRFSYILVDEFQDTNPIQYAFLKILSGEHHNLFVVGDDDQSIYGFRGANPEVMKMFAKEFADTKIYFLNNNYRSTKTIVEAANRVICENKNRMEKKMHAVNREDCAEVRLFESDSIAAQYEEICEMILQEPEQETAVIFRTHHEMELMRAYLEEKNIRYETIGNCGRQVHFVEEDIFSMLRFICGERKRKDFLKVSQILGLMIEREYLPEENVDLPSLVRNLEETGEKEKADAVGRLLKKLEIGRKLSPGLLVRFVRNTLGYEHYLQKFAGDDEIHYLYLKKLADNVENKAKDFEKMSRFLQWWENKEPEKREEKKTGDSSLKLLTMHAAKGLEFDCVFIPNINEGMIPHGKNLSEKELEEERRIFYVGMTRARKKLFLFCEREGKDRPGKRSRFLKGFG